MQACRLPKFGHFLGKFTAEQVFKLFSAETIPCGFRMSIGPLKGRVSPQVRHFPIWKYDMHLKDTSDWHLIFKGIFFFVEHDFAMTLFLSWLCHDFGHGYILQNFQHLGPLVFLFQGLSLTVVHFTSPFYHFRRPILFLKTCVVTHSCAGTHADKFTCAIHCMCKIIVFSLCFVIIIYFL